MIVLIEGCGSNLASVSMAIERLGREVCVTSDPKLIQNASHIIMPGVSSAQRASSSLRENKLWDLIPKLSQPILGICSGMQILFQWCQEGNVEGLGIFKDKVIQLDTQGSTLPHMGWNTLNLLSQNELFNDIANDAYVYFVHSFAASVGDFTLATSTYGTTFSAVVNINNFFGVQFHPERSGKIGEIILSNFLQCRNV